MVVEANLEGNLGHGKGGFYEKFAGFEYSKTAHIFLWTCFKSFLKAPLEFAN